MVNNRTLGSALISALFIMTLVAIAATAMSIRLQTDIYRTRTSINTDQLYLASQAITLWAMDQLSNNKTPLIDEKFPEKLKKIYPNIILSGQLFDMQARFNINNLQDNKFQILFYNLLAHLPIKTDLGRRKLIYESIRYWISPYQIGRGLDEHMDFYLKQKPPYYPGFQLMQNSSELRLVQGVSGEIYQSLQPYLTALPEVTPININTASKPILMSLGNGLSDAQVNELIEARGEKGMANLIKISVLLKKLNIPNEQITTESQYFLSVAKCTSKDNQLDVYTLIKRSKNKQGQISLTMMSQSLNTR